MMMTYIMSFYESLRIVDAILLLIDCGTRIYQSANMMSRATKKQCPAKKLLETTIYQHIDTKSDRIKALRLL
jgi:hypothetical protein